MPKSPNSSNPFWLPLAFSGVLVVGILVGIKLQQEVPMGIMTSNTSPTEASPGKIEELLRYIEARYVDNVNREELVQQAIKSLLDQLDPHSVYLTPEQVKYNNENLDGKFDGIGIEHIILDDTLVVLHPIPGGPADKAGIQQHDRLISVGDSSIVGLDFIGSGLIDSLRGEKGTAITLGVMRPGTKELLTFDLVRDAIPIHSVEAAYMLNQHTGYIKIKRFSSTTHTEFLDKLEEMVDGKGLENIIIDVRGNPGGYLQEATSILNQFFKEKDQLLVYTEGRHVHRSDYETTGKSFFNIKDIVVLIDENSASASEILAGTIQDYDRGIIIGRRSFGKGLVQEQYALRDGSAVRITVARYYTPSGRSIQRNYDNLYIYENEVNTRLQNGELYSETFIKRTDTTKYYTKDGRVVYAGGGIEPDIFIPLDTIITQPFFVKIKQELRRFAYQFYQKQQQQSGQEQLGYKNIVDFVRNFAVSADTFQAFIHSLEPPLQKEAVTVTALEPTVKLLLKARIADFLFPRNGQYAVLNEEDAAVKKAVQILEMPNPLTVLNE